VTAHAATGVANASPVKVAAGRHSSTSHDREAPSATITARKAAALIAIRTVMNTTWPSRMSVGSRGDDTAVR
jgi:hypothetical protein